MSGNIQMCRNNKYMKNYNKNKDQAYLMALNGKNASKFNKNFVKNYGEDSNKMFEIGSRSLKLAYVVPEVKVTSVEKALIIK